MRIKRAYKVVWRGGRETMLRVLRPPGQMRTRLVPRCRYGRGWPPKRMPWRRVV